MRIAIIAALMFFISACVLPTAPSTDPTPEQAPPAPAFATEFLIEYAVIMEQRSQGGSSQNSMLMDVAYRDGVVRYDMFENPVYVLDGTIIACFFDECDVMEDDSFTYAYAWNELVAMDNPSAYAAGSVLMRDALMMLEPETPSELSFIEDALKTLPVSADCYDFTTAQGHDARFCVNDGYPLFARLSGTRTLADYPDMPITFDEQFIAAGVRPLPEGYLDLPS